MLLAIVLVLGPSFTRIPRDLVQVGVGTLILLILLFRMRWPRKAVLRSAGVIPLHDEEAAFAKETAALRGLGGAGHGWDRVAFVSAACILRRSGG